MKNYSTVAQIAHIRASLGPAPMLVFDMDGNILRGFTLAEKAHLPLNAGDDPKSQSIPSGSSQSQIQSWVAQGILKEGVFAEKPMDVMLPPELVEGLNNDIAKGKHFSLCFLTSRSLGAALEILRASGVNMPDQVTMIADSGASIRIKGEQKALYSMTPESAAHLNAMESLLPQIREAIHEEIRNHGLSPETAPSPGVEIKGYAINIHYREILKHVGQGESSPLDHAISERVKTILEDYAEAGPNEPDGTKVFSVLDGPATVEFKIDRINKGVGFTELMKTAVESGHKPSAVLFAGDDVSKNGYRGTDYFAMIRTKALQTLYSFPFFNAHVHHPVGNDMNGTLPDPAKDPKAMTAYEMPDIHLTLPTPRHLLDLTLSVLGWKKEAAPALESAAPARKTSLKS